jgi:hypothetical protein
MREYLAAAPNEHQKSLMDERQLAEFLGIKPDTIRKWRVFKKGPRAIKSDTLFAIRWQTLKPGSQRATKLWLDPTSTSMIQPGCVRIARLEYAPPDLERWQAELQLDGSRTPRRRRSIAPRCLRTASVHRGIQVLPIAQQSFGMLAGKTGSKTG